MQYPDALLRSAALASRRDLQNRQVNENQDLFRDVAEEFNDWAGSSGGIVAPTDPIFELIETEAENRSGPITSAIVFAEWRDIVRLYSICVANWEASGKHDREAGIEEESERVQSAIVMLQDAQKDYEECVATIK